MHTQTQNQIETLKSEIIKIEIANKHAELAIELRWVEIRALQRKQCGRTHSLYQHREKLARLIAEAEKAKAEAKELEAAPCA